MLVIPAVDISRGRCVQLVGGRIETAKIYGDPTDWAKRWQREGAECIHVVDLDAALGLGDNLEIILKILREVDVPVQVGGGIRSRERAEILASGGAERIILGTAAVSNPTFLDSVVRAVGKKRVVVAIDSKKGKVAVGGWQRTVDMSPVEAARMFEGKEIWGFLFTCVDVEGRMSGAALEEVKEVVSSTRLPVIASGGVGDLDDLRKLREAGAYGVVVGKALYEKKFSLQEAMEVVAT